MQRSLVKEFKNGSSSLFNSTVLATHSILMSRQQLSPRNDIQKLAIKTTSLHQQRPNDINLQADMLVVFQAIEIERLTWDIQMLKGKIRERQDVVINAGSYEVQIRELAQKCNKVQNQKYSYIEELSKTKEMGQIIFNQLTTLKSRYDQCDFSAAEKYKLEKQRNQELALQIEKWKGRYSALDKAKSEQAQNNRRTFELHRDSSLNAGSKQILAKMQLQRQELMGRLRERKEQLDQKQLELKKMNNCYEQLQVRLKQQDHSIEQYEQKVAMLSQENYRLSQILRVRGEEIKNLKMANEHDISLRLSQVTCLDQTKHRLNQKLKSMQGNNEELRLALRRDEQQLAALKKKVSQNERLEMQIKEARKEAQAKLKSIERKDKRILILQQQIKIFHKNQQSITSFKRQNQQLAQQISTLKVKIDQKTCELKKLKQLCSQLTSSYSKQIAKLNSSIKQYENLQQQIEKKYKKLASEDRKDQQKSAALELRAKQAALVIKEKDYTISSLQNQLKMFQARFSTSEKNNLAIKKELELQLQIEKKKNQAKVKQTQNQRRQFEMILQKERESLQLQRQDNKRYYQQQLREIEVDCRDTQRIRSEKEEEVLQLRHLLGELINSQDEFAVKQTEMSSQLRFLQSRFTKIQEIILMLRNSLNQRYRAAIEYQQQFRNSQAKYNQLQQWFARFYQKYNPLAEYSPSPKKKTEQTIVSSRIRQFYSPEVPRSSQNAFNSSTSIYGINHHNEQFSHSISKGGEKQIPIEWLMKFIMLCVEVQSLRKRVGDKQAKVESLRNSISSKNTGGSTSSTLLNGLHSSNFSNQSGFFTTRENSLNRKGNIYY